MNCTIDKKISGTPEKKYYLIKFLKSELEKILGREVQIFLLMNETQRQELFKMPAYIFSASNYNFGDGMGNGFNFGRPTLPTFNFGIGSPNIMPLSKGYEPGELTLPYKNFHNLFESLFNINKNKNNEFQKEKEQNFTFKITGGDSETNAETNTENKENAQLEIEKFLFYTMKNDLNIRIAF
jgi:hypothetical protein